MGDALTFLKDLQESGSIDRISPELGIHHPSNVVKGSKCFGREPLHTLRLLVEQKGFQNGMRVFLIQVILSQF